MMGLAVLECMLEYGPAFMSGEEFEKLKAASFAAYYGNLGGCLLKLKGREFWRYHASGLKALGYRLSWRGVLDALFGRCGRSCTGRGSPFASSSRPSRKPRSDGYRDIGMTMFERLVVRADERFGGALFRAVVGFALVPAWLWLMRSAAEGWTLFVFAAGVLATLRVVPGVLRKLLPFGDEVRGLWAARRQLAKRFDSYQWQKLFPIGLGLMAYLLASREHASAAIALALTYVVAGGIGLIVWRRFVSRRGTREPHRL